MLIQVTITGKTPLIMNRFHEEAQQEASSRVHSRKEQPEPEADAKNRLYQNETGVYFPAENLRQSFIEAAKRHKIGRRSATTDVAAAVYVAPFAIPLSDDYKWHIDSRPVVIPATGGRIMRHRPMFDEWGLKFDIQLEEILIDHKTIRLIVTDAGNFVGAGDFRPARKGPYGKFQIDKWEIVDEK